MSLWSGATPEPATVPGALHQELADLPGPLPERDSAVATRLRSYLEDALGLTGPLVVQQFHGGKANVTYLVRGPQREVVVRRPPFGPLPERAHDMEREHRVMAALSTALPFVPRPLHLCRDRSIIGLPFFVMERRHGVVLRDGWPEQLGDDPRLPRTITESLLDVTVAMHSLDPSTVGLEDLGWPEGFMQRQVRRWQIRWQRTATRQVDGTDELFAWLLAQEHPAQAPTIIHNDLKLDNVILSFADLRVNAVLDWEMCTLGDPLADLGTLLAYWAEPGDDPVRYGGLVPATARAGFPSRSAFVDAYAARTGRDVSAMGYYEVFGLVKLAVICEQLLRRYREGHTCDGRFATYESQVPALFRQARRIAATDKRKERG